MPNEYPRVIRHKNLLRFPELVGPACFTSFQKAVYQTETRMEGRLLLDPSNTGRIFPDAAVPIGAYLDMCKEAGVKLETRNAPPYLVSSRLLSPLRVATARYRELNFPLAKMWKFTDAPEIAKLVSLFVKALAAEHVCSAGVLEAFEWCLNEVMDNVLQHSADSAGFVMMQVHNISNRLAVCIADHGQGILESLRPSRHHPTSFLNAITLAIQAGVTRDPQIGQGNGLWGLSEIVRLNQGRLNLMSGSAALFFDGTFTRTFEGLPCCRKRPGTAVDFQIHINKSIDVRQLWAAETILTSTCVWNRSKLQAEIIVSKFRVFLMAPAHGDLLSKCVRSC